MIHRSIRILSIALVVFSLGEQLSAAQKTVSLDKAEFQPGKEVTISDPRAGEMGYYKVFLPRGYTPDRKWPVIFCYHGLNQKPQLTPFSRILGGEHFIIIGMGYHKRGLDGYKHLKTEDVEILKNVCQSLDPRIKMDKTKLFVGGFSKGAFYASGMLNRLPAFWAGAIMFGGGKYDSTDSTEAFKDKPIFVSCGEKDDNMDCVKETRDYYGKLGAKVTGEVLAGVKHAVGYKTTKAREWLIENGPLAGIKEKLFRAQAAERARRYGQAYSLYSAAAAISKTEEKCIAAAKAAKTIAEKADAGLAAADKLASGKKYVEAVKAFSGLAATYEGSIFGRRAAERLAKLKADPRIAAVIKQAEIDGRAGALEAKCEAAEKAGDYALAIKLYEKYVADFSGASRYNTVKARLEKLRSDKSIQADIRAKQAEKDCKGWYSMAENYIKAGFRDKARKYLNRIIDKYGDTDWGKKARTRLSEIDRK
jgi:dienelactone hydrolase